MRRVTPAVLGVAGLVSAAVLGVVGAGSATAVVPGNNGTVKIDREAFDDHPNNEPHVGCTFQVDFYGYDKGDLDAKVTFEAWAPTKRESDSQVLLTDEVFIGEDDNSGGGSQNGLDASRTYTLDLSGISPHPKQGVHVKLTVNAEGSQGADVKHKVFWVTGCYTPSPSPSPTDSGTHSPSPSPSHPTSEPSHPSPTATSPTSTSTTEAPTPCTSDSESGDCDVVEGAPGFTG